MKLWISIALIMALAASLASAEAAEHQFDPVVRTADSTWVGESQLIRSPNRVQAIVRTSDLDPGAAMTVWWRIYNRPRHCAVPFACEASDLSNPAVDGSQLHATAFIVGNADGTHTIVASLYRTAARAQGGDSFDDTLSEAYLNGRGLRRPLNAEVEVLIANHGRVADPARDGEHAVLEQLLTPTGAQLGCADPAAPSPSRTFRCGVVQRVDHGAVTHGSGSDAAR